MITTWAMGTPDQVSARPGAGAHRAADFAADPAALERFEHLEHELFGDPAGGPAAPGHDPADPLVRELNALRSALGWLPVDGDGRWCWPE
jgi:hypothetical protein